jgi:hypothetical protein
MYGGWQIISHNALHSHVQLPWGSCNGETSEILEYILMNLRLLALKAQETDFGSLSSVLEVRGNGSRIPAK